MRGGLCRTSKWNAEDPGGELFRLVHCEAAQVEFEIKF
jgi:hypothetical protein